MNARLYTTRSRASPDRVLSRLHVTTRVVDCAADADVARVRVSLPASNDLSIRMRISRMRLIRCTDTNVIWITTSNATEEWPIILLHDRIRQ